MKDKRKSYPVLQVSPVSRDKVRSLVELVNKARDDSGLRQVTQQEVVDSIIQSIGEAEICGMCVKVG